MKFRFFHNSTEKRVHKVPIEPNVVEEKARGKIIGYTISMEYTDIWAENSLRQDLGQWKHPMLQYPRQLIEARHTRNRAISYFMNRHTPKGDEIDEANYLRLAAEYENAAMKNA